METVCSSETLIRNCKSTLRYNPEDKHRHDWHCPLDRELSNLHSGRLYLGRYKSCSSWQREIFQRSKESLAHSATVSSTAGLRRRESGRRTAVCTGSKIKWTHNGEVVFASFIPECILMKMITEVSTESCWKNLILVHTQIGLHHFRKNGEDGSCSSVTNDRRTAPRPKLLVSAGRLQELRSQTRRLSWVRVPVKMLGLGLKFFPHDIQRYVSNDRPMIRFRAIKIDNKCKHLSNFPAVILRALR
jgi:hypothetical protein